MRRREFIAVVSTFAALPVSAAQRRTVAVLMPYPETDAEVKGRVAAFREEMLRLGWDDLLIEERWSTDDLVRVRADVADLVRLKPDVIFYTGGRVSRILQGETRSIPTVFVGVSDPLEQGLVPSLAKPGGNLTGIALPPYSITAKLVDLLKQIAPSVSRAAIVLNPDNPATPFNRKEFEIAVSTFGITPSIIPIKDADEISPAFESFAREPDGGLVFPSDLTILALRDTVTATATRHRLPAVYSDRVMVMAGGLASYSADRTEMFRQGAAYVARILRGENAGDLPVQQPTRFEFVVNTKAAQAVGVTLPPTILARADEVVE